MLHVSHILRGGGQIPCVRTCCGYADVYGMLQSTDGAAFLPTNAVRISKVLLYACHCVKSLYLLVLVLNHFQTTSRILGITSSSRVFTSKEKMQLPNYTKKSHASLLSMFTTYVYCAYLHVQYEHLKALCT